MNDNARFVPWIVVGIAVFVLGIAAVPPGESAEKMNVYEFGTIPVIDGGRTKPFDTFARTTLFSISDRQTYVDENDQSQPAVKWALDVMSGRLGPDGKTPLWIDHKVFRITNDQVLNLLGLSERSGFRYSLREVLTGDADHPTPDDTNLQKLMTEAAKAEAREAGQRDLYEIKVLELAKNVALFRRILGRQTPLMVPGKPNEEWVAFGDAVFEDNNPDPARPAARYLSATLNAYGANRPEAFNKLLGAYKEQLTNSVSAREERRVSFEVFFNHFEPFYVCSILYVFAFILACGCWILLAARGSWGGWCEALRQSAFWLAALTLIVHTFALGARMYMLDRPLVFVTNLYSSAIFIGWGALILCLAIERFFPLGIAVAVGSTLGALTLIVAHNIAVGDTLEMMQAVLDTNFWLATHVTCVTLGYMATFVAGFIAVGFIIAGVFTRALKPEIVKLWGQMLYGVLCFAMTFSFIGTVLGGIWADQSWGRFWGWDPKENGALLIVIWNALILHARWAGMVKQRGTAVLAVAGNIVTSWSWFGTNMLGIGLHAYGFMQGAVFWLLAFIASQIVLIGIGSMPLRMWASFAEAPKHDDTLPPPPPPVGKKLKKSKRGTTAVQPA
jgi:ABC-type transport system involved in cytochrome c biogenesis permease subunit